MITPRNMITDQMREMSPRDFSDMLRTAEFEALRAEALSHS